MERLSRDIAPDYDGTLIDISFHSPNRDPKTNRWRIQRSPMTSLAADKADIDENASPIDDVAGVSADATASHMEMWVIADDTSTESVVVRFSSEMKYSHESLESERHCVFACVNREKCFGRKISFHLGLKRNNLFSNSSKRILNNNLIIIMRTDSLSVLIIHVAMTCRQIINGCF